MSKSASSLLIALAPLMPSGAAIQHASLEWQLARQFWLEALAGEATTEAQARALAAETFHHTRREVFQ